MDIWINGSWITNIEICRCRVLDAAGPNCYPHHIGKYIQNMVLLFSIRSLNFFILCWVVCGQMRIASEERHLQSCAVVFASSNDTFSVLLFPSVSLLISGDNPAAMYHEHRNAATSPQFYHEYKLHLIMASMTLRPILSMLIKHFASMMTSSTSTALTLL